MLGAGITGNLTGCRADLIICDDVEVPNTCDTAAKREELRTRLRELSFVQAGAARMLYVGTPHAVQTIYATDATSKADEIPFLMGFSALRVPVLDDQGHSAWPEKYQVEQLDDVRRIAGAAMFQSQMMLEPTAVATPILDPGLMPVFDGELVYVRELNKFYIGERKIIAVRAWWDPALAEGRGDSSVVAVVAFDDRGHAYVQTVQYIHPDLSDGGDNATAQCAQVADLCARYNVPVIGLEINGLGRLLPGLLRAAMVRARARAAVVEKSNKTAKKQRIEGTFTTRLAARMLHVHRSVLSTPLMQEMRDFRPSATQNRDDGLDAVAGALSMGPETLPGYLQQRRRK